MNKSIQTTSISLALSAAGGIASFSAFDFASLRNQPASRSLPTIHWLFSRGSHVFPTAAAVASAGFAYLASQNNAKGYGAAAALCIAIGPWTQLVMVPTNFRLMDLNKEQDGRRSEGSAKAGQTLEEFSDTSGPQTKTKETTAGQDAETRRLIDRFVWMNYIRAAIIGAGGVVGLMTALSDHVLV